MTRHDGCMKIQNHKSPFGPVMGYQPERSIFGIDGMGEGGNLLILTFVILHRGSSMVLASCIREAFCF